MIPLTDKIRLSLYDPLCYNIVLAKGRATHLAWSIRQTGRFLDFVLKYAAAHGQPSAVRWLKANLVAIQKELGQDRLETLHALTPDLPYSKTANGLPRLIPASERGRMRKGDVKVIRFYTGLFNLYRVIQIPGDLKLQTITAPFNGNFLELATYVGNLKDKRLNFFNRLPDFGKILKSNLVPDNFVLSRSASPSCKMSCLGILTDIHLLNTEMPELWQEILYYLHSVGTKTSSPFLNQLQAGYLLIKRLVDYDGKTLIGVKTGRELTQHDHLMSKDSIRAHGLGPGRGISQFAIKSEAAGKIRLFALMDSVTQSVLAPLHEAMFNLLRLIPNDGTFNQEESIRRSQFKAIQAGKAFSFDLTAATDRLPAFFTAILIEDIFKKLGMAECWLNIMTARPFGFNATVAQKLKVSVGPYRYAVGQPMGGLSSWAGLAITHHWIVQMAAFSATGSSSWNEEYEILGDDLVIFNDKIAEKYLEIMTAFGCEINLSKSIVSRNRPVFEFAKRTCWGPHIVSGISLAQVRAGWRVAGRVANALSFSNSGLITSSQLLAITLSKYAFSKGINTVALELQKGGQKANRYLALGILSLLGSLYQSGKISQKVLMTALVNPHYEDADYSGEAVGLPLRASLNVAFSTLNDPDSPGEVTWSHQETRDEVFKEYKSELATIMLQAALKKASLLLENSELYVQQFAQKCYFPAIYADDVTDAKVDYNDYPSDYKLLLTQIENFVNRALGLEDTSEDPETLYDTIYKLAYEQAKWERMSFEEASKWLEKVETFEYKLTLKEAAKPGRTVLESAPILSAMRQMDPKIVNRFERPYWSVPGYKSLYLLDEAKSAQSG